MLLALSSRRVPNTGMPRLPVSYAVENCIDLLLPTGLLLDFGFAPLVSYA